MDLTTKTSTIQVGEKKVLGIFKRPIEFKIEADIPESMLDEYGKISAMDAEKLDKDPEKQKEAFSIMKNIVREMLYTHNKKKPVDKFVDSLGIKSVNKLFVFLNNYANGVDEEKKNE
jgi:hypothetical protein